MSQRSVTSASCGGCVSSSHVIFLASALARSRVYSLSLPEPNTTSFSSPLTRCALEHINFTTAMADQLDDYNQAPTPPLPAYTSPSQYTGPHDQQHTGPHDQQAAIKNTSQSYPFNPADLPSQRYIAAMDGGGGYWVYVKPKPKRRPRSRSPPQTCCQKIRATLVVLLILMAVGGIGASFLYGLWTLAHSMPKSQPTVAQHHPPPMPSLIRPYLDKN
jgi:hypothetical protein